MGISIQCEEVFKNRLSTGINLFTGAGFSTLKSPSNNCLPTGKQLCKEIIEHFSLSDVSEDDGLDYVSEFCPESEYQNYLRERFSVTDYNPLYNSLMKVNIKSIITTNIDNIIRKVVDRSNDYYISNIREYGAPSKSSNEIVYIPLHGDVDDINSRLFFGKFELSDVENSNSDLFKQMFSILSTNPTLFWGYNFNDNGVLKIIKDIIGKSTSDIWVQLLPDDSKNKKLFEGKGCHIIEANTKELLEWIQTFYQDSSTEIGHSDLSALEKYMVPSLSKVPKIPTIDYFKQGITEWYPVLAGVTYERDIIAKAENLALEGKSVIFVGSHFTGKTTALMQLARKINSGNKLYVENITKEEAVFIKNKLNGKKAWIFYNNCCKDVDAYLTLANSTNIYLIGTSDDYLLETVKHLLPQNNIKYSLIDCNELNRDEAMLLYQKLPTGIRKNHFTYKKSDDEKYSMLEFITNNVIGAYTKKIIENIFSDLKINDSSTFKIILLASYLSEYGSAISYQIVSHLLNTPVYPDAINATKNAINFLRTIYYDMSLESIEQDYFILRSKLFAINARNILIEKFKEEYGLIIKNFILNESFFNILRYDIFRRKAYDANFFHSLFSYDEAMGIYNNLYDIDKNPYTLQQKALCRGLFGDYLNAFIDIDKALSCKPNNFSFKNSQAILLFESNCANHDANSIDSMKQAMKVLEQCYHNDKRKIYHAQKFAEFAITMHNSYGCSDYLKKAQDWLIEMTQERVIESKNTVKLKEELANILSKM